MAGAGTVSANGGNGAPSVGGGGGGGRIAIYSGGILYLGQPSFTGTVSAFGGGGAAWGGAGTIFIQTTGQKTQLIIDNGTQTGTNTLLQSLSSADLILRNGAIATASSLGTVSSVLIGSNAWFTTTYPNTLNLFVTGNATVQAGAGIIADGAGYAAGAGIGAGRAPYISPSYAPAGGGGHGGYGATGNSSAGLTGGITYDTTTSPTQFGSGGGDASPSGIVRGAGRRSVHLP